MAGTIILPSGDEVDRVRGYREEPWREYTNYVCLQCQYATLWIEKMKKHQAAGEHPWAYPGQNPPPSLSEGGDEPTY